MCDKYLLGNTFSLGISFFANICEQTYATNNFVSKCTLIDALVPADFCTHFQMYFLPKTASGVGVQAFRGDTLDVGDQLRRADDGSEVLLDTAIYDGTLDVSPMHLNAVQVSSDRVIFPGVYFTPNGERETLGDTAQLELSTG